VQVITKYQAVVYVALPRAVMARWWEARLTKVTRARVTDVIHTKLRESMWEDLFPTMLAVEMAVSRALFLAEGD
jgi:hypothetical protein